METPTIDHIAKCPADHKGQPKTGGNMHTFFVKIVEDDQAYCYPGEGKQQVGFYRTFNPAENPERNAWVHNQSQRKKTVDDFFWVNRRKVL